MGSGHAFRAAVGAGIGFWFLYRLRSEWSPVIVLAFMLIFSCARMLLKRLMQRLSNLFLKICQSKIMVDEWLATIKSGRPLPEAGFCNICEAVLVPVLLHVGDANYA